MVSWRFGRADPRREQRLVRMRLLRPWRESTLTRDHQRRCRLARVAAWRCERPRRHPERSKPGSSPRSRSSGDQAICVVLPRSVTFRRNGQHDRCRRPAQSHGTGAALAILRIRLTSYGWNAPIAGQRQARARPDAAPTRAHYCRQFGSGATASTRTSCLNSSAQAPGIGASAICQEIRGWAVVLRGSVPPWPVKVKTADRIQAAQKRSMTGECACEYVSSTYR